MIRRPPRRDPAISLGEGVLELNMSSTATLRKQLKIKTGSLNRLAKEYKLYIKESEEQRVKLAKLVEDKAEDKAEDWDVRNARKMLEEALKMVTNEESLLNKANAELRELVDFGQQDPEIKDDDPELVAAKGALASVS